MEQKQEGPKTIKDIFLKFEKDNRTVYIAVGASLLITAIVILMLIFLGRLLNPGCNQNPYENMTAFNKECLERHNFHRQKHGVPPLTIDESLYEFAKLEAGENLYVSKGPVGHEPQCVLVVDGWYSEISKFMFNIELYEESEYFHKIGHFTQVVWKSTQKLGCGYALKDDESLYVACHYRPGGNYFGQYTKNVLPPL